MIRDKKHPEFEKEQSKLKDIWQDCKSSMLTLCNKKKKKIDEKKEAKKKEKEGYGRIPPLNKEIDMVANEIRNMEKILEKPYFGKIVIGAPNSKETYYIGKYWLNCENDQIISWLAPIANIYYSKKGAYSIPGGKEITVELHLVRTLDIERDVLLDINDDVTKDKEMLYQDPFLLKQLKRTGQQRLKDVVISIQEEQNEIIRAPNEKHLAIQGSAGTGKTIVLVYRVAYLMYNNDWSYNDVLFISPSKLFLGFVKNILPDLDMDTLSQINLTDLVPLNSGRKLRDLNIFPEILGIEKNKRSVASDAADFKGTSAFKQLIDNKINDITEDSTRKIKDFNFKYEGKTEKISASTIKKWFLEDFNHFSLGERKKLIRARIKIMLENYLESSLSARTSERIFTPQEVEKMLGQYFKDWPDFKKIYNVEAISWYVEILKSTGQLGEALDNAQTEISQNVSDWDKYFSCFTLNDWAAFFYMYQRIVGENQDKYKLIAIDEAQMLSPLWLSGLNYLLEEGGKINLTGDLNQKPPMIDLYDWSDLEEVVGPIETRELAKCYRLTDEVAKYALDVLFKHPSPYHFETVGRIGEEILKLEGKEEDKLNKALEAVSDLFKKYDTTAIVGRTTQHCEKIFADIEKIKRHGEKYSLVNSNNEELNRLVVIPVGLIGGLEFDVVVVADHEKYDLQDIHETQQLYLAVTRAVHKLILA